jgi:hypothetical protein
VYCLCNVLLSSCNLCCVLASRPGDDVPLEASCLWGSNWKPHTASTSIAYAWRQAADSFVLLSNICHSVCLILWSPLKGSMPMCATRQVPHPYLCLNSGRPCTLVASYHKPCMVTLLDIVFPMSHAMVEVLMVLQGFLLRSLCKAGNFLYSLLSIVHITNSYSREILEKKPNYITKIQNLNTP